MERFQNMGYHSESVTQRSKRDMNYDIFPFGIQFHKSKVFVKWTIWCQMFEDPFPDKASI